MLELLILDMANYKIICQCLKEKKDEYEVTWYRMTGVTGVDFERVRGSYNPIGEEARKENQRKKIESLEKEINELEQRKKRVEDTLQRISDSMERDFIRDVLIDGMTYEKACMTYGIASKSKIKKEIERILTEAREGE